LETERLAQTKDIVHSAVIWESDADILLLHSCYSSTLHMTEANRNAIFKKVIFTRLRFLLQDSSWPHTVQRAMLLLADIGGTPVRTLTI
jgi:hypothetical protein